MPVIVKESSDTDPFQRITLGGADGLGNIGWAEFKRVGNRVDTATRALGGHGSHEGSSSDSVLHY